MSDFMMTAPTFDNKSTDKVALIDADFLKYLVCYDVSKELERREKDRVGLLIEKIVERLNEIMPEVQCKAKVFLWSCKTEDNFRTLIAKEKKYKGNRSSRPPLYEQMYEDMDFVYTYINEQNHHLRFDNIEADDLLGMLIGPKTFIYSKDKDSRTIPGTHWDMEIRDFIVVTDDDAWRKTMYQVLGGDSGDNILGLRGWGLDKVVKGELKKGKVNKLLDPLPTAMLLPTIMSEYFKALGRKDGWDAMVETYNLVGLQSNRGTYMRENYDVAYKLIETLTRIG